MGGGNQLTSLSVDLLITSCPHLRWVGDLRHWSMTSSERKALRREREDRWRMTRTEPARNQDSCHWQLQQLQQQQLRSSDVQMDTDKIASGMLKS